MSKLFSAAFVALALLALPHRASAQIILIANPALKIDSISHHDARDIFTGTSPDLIGGVRLKPVLMKRGPTHDDFLAEIIGVKESEFRSGWMGLLFAGKGFLPPSVASEPEMVDFIAQHPGTVGYIHKATPHKGVTVLEFR